MYLRVKDVIFLNLCNNIFSIDFGQVLKSLCKFDCILYVLGFEKSVYVRCEFLENRYNLFMSNIAESLEILVESVNVLRQKIYKLALESSAYSARLKRLKIYVGYNSGQLNVESNVVSVVNKLNAVGKNGCDFTNIVTALLKRHVKVERGISKLGKKLNVPAERHLVVLHLGNFLEGRKICKQLLDSAEMYRAVKKNFAVNLNSLELRNYVGSAERRSFLINLSLGTLVFNDHVVCNRGQLLLDALLESFVGNVLLDVLINYVADLLLKTLLALLVDFGKILFFDNACRNRYVDHIGNVLSEILGGLSVVYNVLEELVVVLRVGAVILVLDIKLERRSPNVLLIRNSGGRYNVRGNGSRLFLFQLFLELICYLVNNELLSSGNHSA